MPKIVKKAMTHKCPYEIVREYFDYHNHQEFISYDEFILEIVPAIAQFQPADLPRNFEQQLRCDVAYYGGEEFQELSKILKNGGWSQSSINQLAPTPYAYNLTAEWIEHWIFHDLKNLQQGYAQMCASVFDLNELTSRRLAQTLKEIEAINKILLKHGVDLAAWHRHIERNHRECSSRSLPKILSSIFQNTPTRNNTMFSAFKNPTIMDKSVHILPPVVAGTLHALREILGWGGAPVDLPICKVSWSELEYGIDVKDFDNKIGQHYKNLQLRAQLFQSTTPSHPKIATPQRKM